MVAFIAATIIGIPLNYVFMFTLGYGLQGLAMTLTVTSVLVFAIMVIYTCCNPETRKVWQPYSCEVFRGWGEYLKISAPATLMLCAEFWAFELLTVFAGILGVMELAA